MKVDYDTIYPYVRHLKHQYCQGCILYIERECTVHPIYIANKRELKCPCMSCPVKIMCSDRCKANKNFVADFNSFTNWWKMNRNEEEVGGQFYITGIKNEAPM